MLKYNIRRSPYQSLAAILVVSLSLFLISIFFLLGSGFQVLLTYFESRPQVSAYLKDEVKPQEVELLRTKIISLSEVKQVDYISKDDALKIYRQQNKDKPLLLEMVTAKTLPASLEVSTDNLSALKKVAEALGQEPLVEDVVFQEDIVSSLANWVRVLRGGGLIVAGFLLLVSILTVLVTLGMKISQRKDEIEVLKLLGASNWYIRRPFYLEGVLYGFVAAVVAWGMSNLLLLYETPFLRGFLSGIIEFPLSPLFLGGMLGGLLVLGMLVGLLGSVLAVSRFLRAIR